jgi:sugar phosphate isomerase/epimerase
LGIGSYTFAWAVGVAKHPPPRPLTALWLLEKAAQLKVSVVQICDNLPLHALPESQLSELERAAAELGIAIEVGTRGIASEHLRHYVDLAVRFHSPILRVVIDSVDREPSLQEVIELLGPIRNDLQQAQVRLAIENHDRFTARQFRQIVTRLDSPYVGICLDTVNSFGALEGPELVVSTLAPFVANLHVKEFQICRLDHQLGFLIEGRPAGQGRLDVPWLLRQLRASAHPFNAILEQWVPPLDSIQETIAREETWARESIAYLRTLIHQ